MEKTGNLTKRQIYSTIRELCGTICYSAAYALITFELHIMFLTSRWGSSEHKIKKMTTDSWWRGVGGVCVCWNWIWPGLNLGPSLCCVCSGGQQANLICRTKRRGNRVKTFCYSLKVALLKTCCNNASRDMTHTHTISQADSWMIRRRDTKTRTA